FQGGPPPFHVARVERTSLRQAAPQRGTRHQQGAVRQGFQVLGRPPFQRDGVRVREAEGGGLTGGLGEVQGQGGQCEREVHVPSSRRRADRLGVRQAGVGAGAPQSRQVAPENPPDGQRV